jgi:hypothetical protein
VDIIYSVKAKSNELGNYRYRVDIFGGFYTSQHIVIIIKKFYNVR